MRMDEFSMEVDFKYGVPMIILDFIYAVTGFDVVALINKETQQSPYYDRLNPDSDQFLNYKSTLPEDFQDLPF